MRELCLFVPKVIFLLSSVAALRGASSEPRVEARCAVLGYYDRVGSFVPVAAQLVNGTHISDVYGMRVDPLTNRPMMHKGVDIAAPAGTPIYAVADGMVAETGRDDISGLYVRIRHNGFQIVFAHLSKFADSIRPGVRVKKGQGIARVGATGRTTGPHLHLSIVVLGKRVKPVCQCGTALRAAKDSSKLRDGESSPPEIQP